MNNIRYIRRSQGDVVEILQDMLAKAEQGELTYFNSVELAQDGSMSYSRAGFLPTNEHTLKVVGGLEHLKRDLMDIVCGDLSQTYEHD